MLPSGAGDLDADPVRRGLPFSPLVEHAIELSAQWHDRTYRKGRWRDEPFDITGESLHGIPVMAHVTAVAITVARAEWDETVIAAAFLHDVLEDENERGVRLRLEQLESVVGIEVTRLVSCLTEDMADRSGRPLSWKDRKQGYLRRLATAPDAAIAISVADKLHNLWSINGALEAGIDVFSNGPERRALSAGAPDQLWFYRSVWELADAREAPKLAPMREQLGEEVSRFVRVSAPYA